MGRLEGKRAIITGGASGLGAAIARRFASEDAAVELIDLPEKAERGLGIADELTAAGARACFVAGDVLEADSIRSAIDVGAAEIGGVDLCVASAGVAAHPDAGLAACSTSTRRTSTSSTTSTYAASSSRLNAPRS